jgi:Ca2+-binding RTX toxin-like protein
VLQQGRPHEIRAQVGVSSSGPEHHLENLEPRLLLSGTDPFDTGPLAIVQGQFSNVKSALDTFDNKLFNQVLGHTLPLVGTALKTAAGTANDLFNTLIGAVNSAFSGLSGAASLTPDDVKGALAGIPGVTGVVESDNVSGGKVTDAMFKTTISGNLITASFSPGFDIGLPGLGLKVNGTVQVTVSYSLQLNLGVNGTEFFIDTSPSGADPEFKVSLDVKTPGLSATGLLGFLELTATDNSATPTDFNASFLVDVVTLLDVANGGNDMMYGGTGDDQMHGGAGLDQMHGGDGNGALFGDLGDDNVFGDAGNDHLYGGAGDDSLDGGLGADIVYGGDGQDTLVADQTGDRLIDWLGNFNTFVVPFKSFGEPVIIRSPAPQMQQFLLDLAASDGATDPFTEISLVTLPSPANSGPGGRF